MPADFKNSSLLLQQFGEKCNKRCKSLAQGCEVGVRPGVGLVGLVERDGAGAFASCQAAWPFDPGSCTLASPILVLGLVRASRAVEVWRELHRH
jgi:hypothetical protein